MSAIDAVAGFAGDNGRYEKLNDLKRKRSDSVEEVEITHNNSTPREQFNDNNACNPFTTTESANSSGYKDYQSTSVSPEDRCKIAELERDAEAVLFSRTYRSYIFDPITPTGFCFGGLRLEMFRTDTIGGSLGDLYFVCAESYFNTTGPLGLKLTLSTQGWLLANSGNTAEKNVHLGPGIDFFVDDMLLSVNGNNLVGLELSEVVSLITSAPAPRKLLTCRFFKSISGAIAWMLKIITARTDAKQIDSSQNINENNVYMPIE